MTTEQDDNRLQNLPHPDVINQMWRREPFNRTIPLSADLENELNKHKKQGINKKASIKKMYEIKQQLNSEEMLVNQAVQLFTSTELKERTYLYLNRLSEQSIKIKEIIYSYENRALLNSIIKEPPTHNEINRNHVFELHADEALWLLSNPSVFAMKSKSADLIHDLQLLHNWALSGQSKLDNRLFHKPLESVEWWLNRLNVSAEQLRCRHCRELTFDQFIFCINCLTALEGERQ